MSEFLIKITSLKMEWIGPSIAFCALLVAIIALFRNNKKDTQDEGYDKGVIDTEIRFINNSIGKMEERLDKIEGRVDDIYKVVTGGK